MAPNLSAEELAEAQQCVGKILRHGYESYNPDLPREKQIIIFLLNIFIARSN